MKYVSSSIPKSLKKDALNRRKMRIPPHPVYWIATFVVNPDNPEEIWMGERPYPKWIRKLWYELGGASDPTEFNKLRRPFDELPDRKGRARD